MTIEQPNAVALPVSKDEFALGKRFFDRRPEHLLRKAALAGDAQAFARLVEPHRALAFHVAFWLLNDVDDANDVVQEVFLKAWLKLDVFQERSAFSTWLHTITRRTTLELIEERKRQAHVLERLEAAKLVEAIIATTRSIESIVLEQEERDNVEILLSTTVTLIVRRPMKSRLAASEMRALPKPSVPRSSRPHGNRPTAKCRCSTSGSRGKWPAECEDGGTV